MRILALIIAALLVAITACNPEPEEVAQPTEAPVLVTQAPSPDAPSIAPATESPPTPLPPQPAEPSEAAAATSAPRAGRDVELWFIRDRNYLMEPEVHQIPGDAQAVARETMELLVKTAPRDPDLLTVIPEGTHVLGVSLKDGDLTVDLDFPGSGPNLGSGFEGALYDQIVHTGAQFPTVKRVRVLEEGKTPRTGHAIELETPRAPREESVAPVVVLEPSHDEHVSRGNVTVSGTANVYEATVELRLIDPDGKSVEQTFATATCGTGCRGTWEHTFRGVNERGSWTVVAAASDPSDGEGPPPYRTKRTFIVE